MMAALYSEFRKFLTVRSTYIVSILALVFIGLIASYGFGYQSGANATPDMLTQSVLQTTSFVGIFVGILAILLVCHEYRFSTITYTLTASNNRLKVMLAKFITVSAYGVIMTLLGVAVTIPMLIVGIKLGGHDLGTQTLEIYPLLWRAGFFIVSSAWFGLLLGFISRSMVFSLVVYFFLPLVEQLLISLLKVSPNYLPNAAQSQVLQRIPQPDMFSAAASAGVFSLYLLGAGIVAVILFVRRDAN